MEGVSKVNVDGPFSVGGEKHGIGFIAQDSEGNFIFAGLKSVWFDGFAEIVEAQALFWAMFVAKEKGWSDVSFEGDCKVIFDSLYRIGSRGFHVQTIIDNCLSFRSYFRSLSFLFCFRDCNGVAHRLAKWAACGLSQEVWDKTGPTWLEDALYSNMTLSDSYFFFSLKRKKITYKFNVNN